MKICVITPRYAFSGVPLAQMRFARALSCKGHDVDLLIGRTDPEYPVPEVPEIHIKKLQYKNVKSMLFPLMKYLRTTKPDVVFSAEDHLNTIVLLAAILTGSQAKISGSSRVTPFDTYSNIPFTKRWILKYLTQAVMWRADASTCVSMGTVEEYRQVFKNPPHVCVYNIIDSKEARLKMKDTISHDWFINREFPVLVAAGNLETWKGYSDLIYGIKEISKRRKVRLILLGDGSLRTELEKQVLDLDLSDKVCLLGNVDNPLKYFMNADVFAHSSHVESLGNVLVEAMMCGCTPVSTDCPTGPREILQDGKYGYLVPMRDPVAMAAGIEQALDNPISPELLAEAIEPFEESVVIQRHFEILGLKDQL